MSELAEELRGIVGPANCIDDPELAASYEVDWTRRFSGRARLVIRPADTAEVAAVVRACARHRAPIVAQGGNTGLVGGGVPRAGEIVLSLLRLREVDPPEASSGLLRAGAGATLAAAQAAAAGAGLEVGIDLAARESATLGGMVATNAGGIHVLRHGSMRARLAGLEAVLADGSVISRMTGAAKDNVGYDLVSLLAGSEGTLAIVTAVLLRLVPAPAHRVTALLALAPDGAAGPASREAAGMRSAVALVGELRRRLPGLEAAEVMLPDGMELVRSHARLPAPPGADAAAWLLIEVGDATDPLERVAEALEGHDTITDSAVATDEPLRGQLWAYRERHTEAISSLGVPHKLDVSLPLGALASFTADLPGAILPVCPEATIVCFGHVGDGNMHVNVIGPGPDDEAVDDAVLALTLAHGGSISAEHGVGVAKRSWVRRARGDEDLAAMLAVKRALDPAGLLNPGVIFP